MNELKRVSDVAPVTTAFPQAVKPADVAGRDLILKDVEFVDGEFGKFAVLTLDDFGKGFEFVVTTGAKPVMAQLELLLAQDALPVIIRFERRGRSWQLV